MTDWDALRVASMALTAAIASCQRARVDEALMTRLLELKRDVDRERGRAAGEDR